MSDLYQFVKKQSSKLPDISYRTIYGLDAFYLRNKPYIVISSDNRIIVKADDFELKAILKKKYQAEQWVLSDKVMYNWFVLPETFNKKKSKLAPILEISSKALLSPKKEKKQRKKKVKKDKQIKNVEQEPKVESSPSFFKKLFKFLS
ncbi:hypothetical protein [Halobacteriovorax sp.]|uniref:hypothetical protein n=1 Tax=Halobacteriovorax sp. TaxID=2020862 RepID=UPI0035638F71